MELMQAGTEQFRKVRSFYWRIIEEMRHTPYAPGWEEGVYPSDAFLRAAISAGELYILRDGESLVGAMVLNHTCTEGYEVIPWQVDAPPEEVTVIHTLGVLPERQRQGLAARLVAEAIQIARKHRQRAIRLDVLGSNLPAQRLYTGLGFRYRGTVPLYYEDTGRTDFLLYEYVL